MIKKLDAIGLVSSTSLLIGMILLPTAASAQAAATGTDAAVTSSDAGVADIVVTAQRRAERLQDVPLSITVMTGQALEQGAIRNLTDFANRQPNFTIQQAPSGDQLSIRGMGSGSNGGFEQSVGTFVDGLYRNRARSTRVAVFDVERIEVLKGPQTTFFGANAIAGALNITTRKPTSNLSVNASALYSPSDGEYNFELGVGGPVLPGVQVRVAGRLSGMDGYVHNDRFDNDGPHNRDGQLRVSTRLEPTSNLTIDTRFDYARNRDPGAYSFEIVNCPPPGGTPSAYCSLSLSRNGSSIDDKPNYHSASRNNFSNIDMYEGEAVARLDLDAVALISTMGYFDQKYLGKTDLVPFPGDDPLNTGTNETFSLLGEKFHQFSQELRLESTGTGPLKFMGGLYYEKNHLNFLFTSGTNGRIPAVGSQPALMAVGYRASNVLGYARYAVQGSRTLSGFGSIKYQVSDALSLTGSLRYSVVRKTADDLSVQYGIVPPSGDPAGFIYGNAAQQAALANTFRLSTVYPVHKMTNRGLMPSATVQYKIGPDIMAYANFVRGFKAGGFSVSNGLTFNPERANTYEIGLKSTLLDRKLQIDVAAFRTDYTNLQQSQSVFSPSTNTFAAIISNAAKSRSSGVELSVVVRPVPRFTLSTDLAYLDSHYISFPGASCYAAQTPATGCPANGSGQSLDGRTREFAPKWSGNVDLAYDMPFNATWSARLGATAYFKTRYNLTASLNPASVQTGYAKLDLRATLVSSRGVELGIIAKNVTDKATLIYFDDSPGNIGSYGALLERPRSIAFSGSLKF